MCVDEGLDGSALFPSAIIILVYFLLLLVIGKILSYAVITEKKIFCVFCSVDDWQSTIVLFLITDLNYLYTLSNYSL